MRSNLFATDRMTQAASLAGKPGFVAPCRDPRASIRTWR
jgi:hypothetical protein